jgi:hypothetical protein
MVHLAGLCHARPKHHSTALPRGVVTVCLVPLNVSLPWSSGILGGAIQKQLAHADILSLLGDRMLCCRMEVAQTPLQR